MSKMWSVCFWPLSQRARAPFRTNFGVEEMKCLKGDESVPVAPDCGGVNVFVSPLGNPTWILLLFLL